MKILLSGRRPVLEALRRHADRVHQVWVARGITGGAREEMSQLAREQRVKFHMIEQDVLTRMIGHAHHQGVAAEVKGDVAVSSDPLDVVNAARERGELPFLLLLDQVQDPYHVGAVIRSAGAAGVHGIVLVQDHGEALTPEVIKISAGAALHVPICVTTNLVRTIDVLKKEGLWIVGAVNESKEVYTHYDWKRPVALVVGREGEGLRRLVQDRCDTLVSIPLHSPMDSLNVSMTVSVLSFEILRQRAGRPAK